MSPREKGQHLLMLGDDMWVYLPDTSRPVRITPLERLSGDASNGDVARTNYAADYTPVYVRSEKAGADDCYVLNLTARRKGATYQRILYWVRVHDDRPVKAEFYLTSGKLIKSATFDEFLTVSGRAQLRRMTLYDEIRHNSHSVLEYSGIAPRELPDKLFYQGRTDRFWRPAPFSWQHRQMQNRRQRPRRHRRRHQRPRPHRRRRKLCRPSPSKSQGFGMRKERSTSRCTGTARVFQRIPRVPSPPRGLK